MRSKHIRAAHNDCCSRHENTGPPKGCFSDARAKQVTTDRTGPKRNGKSAGETNGETEKWYSEG